MNERIKTGVSLPKEIIRILDEYMKLTGLKSRSKVLSDAVLNFINEQIWLETERDITGVLIVVYNEKRGDTVRRFLDVQHDYLDEIIATMHTHVTHDKCLEVILVKSKSTYIRRLVGEIQNITGIEYTKFVPIPMQQDSKHD